MTGKKYASEKYSYIDKKSGRTVTQLTQSGINFHLYFTENSFDINNQEIYFLSNRASGGEKFNLFHMELESGIMTQLTDEPKGIDINNTTKTPDSELIAYVSDKTVKILNTRTKECKEIYKEKNMLMHNFSFSPDKKRLGFIRNEDVNAVSDGGPNYAGFKEKMFATKEGRVSVINIDGSGFRDVFIDTHWLSHFQFSPDDNSIAMYCHEGPWNYVHQRIWIINMETSEVIPCFRQKEDDCVGHEIWTKDGYIMFDNRREGHDGTISSDKTQVTLKEPPRSDKKPFLGFADKNGEIIRTIDMPFYCNHYMLSSDNTLIVGDGVEDIFLINLEKFSLRDESVSKIQEKDISLLSNHNTTWLYQRSHCHPIFSWDDKKILYTADKDIDSCNIFMLEL